MWTYVFFLVVIIVSPALSTDYKMMGHDPVEVERNKDAILPCHVEPETDLTQDFVEWHVKLTNGEDIVVYIYRRGKEILPLDCHFINRTEILKEDLLHGNISVKIRNVTEKDEGNYTCVVEIGETKRIQSSVKLIVRSKDDPSPLKDVSYTAPSPSSSSPPRPTNVGAIVGPIVAGLVLGVGVFFLLKHIKKRKPQQGLDAAAPSRSSSSPPRRSSQEPPSDDDTEQDAML
ncbi:uncharacterized protein LOC117386430 [Periophthalmus magnuspinnatus]|uniref:uncharacterized protein LOC117386430 n=1 Tax=Periophthalmus magnuspinnatus TaxID=409849 RepID=UPI00243670A0|nr:uncharacterized protein LOC117386430 [Periophthalmus magnuspinnatus]